MQLPTWIPKIPKPWNPAYRSTWEAMSDNEKRWSFLFDVGVIAVVFTGLWFFSQQN